MNENTELTVVTHEVIDRWATESDGPVALRLRQKLLPVEESGIVFPPTYADIGYNIDTLADGTRVATIDSVGSQANRMEPLFKSQSSKKEDWLVPKIEIVIRKEPCGECAVCKENAGNRNARSTACEQPREVTRSLLDLAHRAADAVVQSSPSLLSVIEPAFKALQRGDAGPLCSVAPTSLVFGVWDSRGDTGEKRPRLVRSIIRAWDVEPLHAAAQFNSVWKLLDDAQKEELKSEAKTKKTDLSEKGLADAPATFRPKIKLPHYRDGAPNPEARVLGGVLVRGRIERDVTVNLVALRGLRGSNPSETGNIRKYLLGLSLVAATAEMDLFLREGCLLRYADDGDAWYAVPRRGEPKPIKLSAQVAKDYANKAAEPFREKWPTPDQMKHRFDLRAAKKLLAKKTDDQGATPG